MSTASALNWVFTLNNYTPKGENELRESVLFEYIIYGHEVAPTTGTPHLQGYFQLQKKKRLNYLLKKLPKGIHLEKAIGNYESNKTYCSKDAQDIYTRGTPSIKGANTNQLYDLILQCRTWPEVLKLPNIERRMTFAREVFNNKPIIPQSNVKLLPWQQKVVDIIKTPPDDRTIHIVYDEKGSKGKTFLAKYLYTNYDAYYISPSKSADLLYAYNGQQIIIYDVPRSCDDDYVNWGAIEKLKDGIFFSGKFASGIKHREKHAHVIIFTNHPIPADKFSVDRLNYIDLHTERNIHNLSEKSIHDILNSDDEDEEYEDEEELIPSTLDYIKKNIEASNEIDDEDKIILRFD
ncbi:replication-associated protein [Crucivirus-158]|nr:replication-associated protein [Crucivirus-158]